MQDANYFTRVMVSPAASMKMLMHAHSGCEAGLSAGGKPLEVMGMMLGYPSDEHKHTLVVTDVFPLPVTGFETQVVADDENVINYMIKLSDMVEVTRKERLMGWYHSHPFDVDEAHNHCFLSSTDLSTQLSWQNAEDPNGNPFLAIVIDPLRSFAKNASELAAFRAYPPTASPPPNQCPDGSIVTEDAKRVEVWGSCWNRYYELKVEYFMSDQAKSIIDILNHSHLWARTLSATPALENQPQYLAEATKKVKEQGFYMKRAMDASDLKGALQHASDMLRELRTSLLTPRNYYELYMKVLDELHHLDDFFGGLCASGTQASELYEKAQACGLSLIHI